ncbi:MAG: potassium transporter Kup [Pseudomonadota bacterium]|nr:potassium transporter Kup [Pseudomonadota bacterium]
MQATQRASLPLLTLGAMGVVFGDIGTSPLYAIKESFGAAGGIDLTQANILGVLSMIFWSILMVMSIKYAAIIMRADNNGEGGMIALLALNLRRKGMSKNQRLLLVALGFIGASLFFGDGIITPAISVLSAVEGLSIATAIFDPYIVPIAIAILVGLFLVQKKGSGQMGKYFGPITLVWFMCLGMWGLLSIVQNPVVLGMVSPHWALMFIWHDPMMAFLVMGAVVLTITGGEALYADMGHFGKVPIRLAWYFVAMPCLLLSYAGQGALLLRDPTAIANPFYLLVPSWALYPMIMFATVAAVIASQAVITGVFSVARQAMYLGYLPRLSIKHTSESEEGQIYIPFLNWLMLVLIILIVLLMQNSSNLASAYGVAVTLTMLCDTLLVIALMYGIWRWAWWKIALVAVPFLLIDLLLVSATAMKIPSGGWITILIGSVVFVLMMTWKRGRELLFKRLQQETLPLDLFINNIGNNAHIVTGTAVFMVSTQKVVPHALLHNIKHNKVLHERNVLMTLVTRDVPYVDPMERYELEQLSPYFWRINAYYGFKEQPNVPDVLQRAFAAVEQPLDMMNTSFFVSRERIFSTESGGMSSWREKLFIAMSRNTSSATDFFQIPPNRVVEMGSQIEI